jgi:hypothetical protein
VKYPFVRAHGYVPGPTERPILTGMASGLIAMVPAFVVASLGRSLTEAARRLDLHPATVVLQFALLLATAGAVYGWTFMRAANDRRGGWLFGLSYGFVAWMLGPATMVLWITGRPLVIGVPAQFMLGAHLVYGLLLGSAFPHVGRLVRRRFARTGIS